MRFTKKMLVALAFLTLMFAFTPVGEAIGISTVTEVSAANHLSKSTLKLRPATSYDLTTDYTTSAVTWSSSNANVAKVTGSGRVYAKSEGTCTIKIKNNTGKVVGSCTVTVACGTKTYKNVQYKDISGTSFGTTGRWFTANSSMFTNASGSAFYFRTCGTKQVKINFVSNTSTSSEKIPFYAYSIDGGAWQRVKITSPTINLGTDKTHYVKVVIDSIATTEKRYNAVGVGVKSVVPVSTKYGSVIGMEPMNNMIAFYGDSITEGVAAVLASYNPKGCSAVNSYAWYTAERLNATPFICGYASTGISKDGNTESIGVIKYQKAADAMKKYTTAIPVTSYDQRVKVVVLEYGTNDAGYSSSKFQSEYSALIAQAHNAYPNALVVCMVPFHNQQFAVQITNAANLYSYAKVFNANITVSGYADSLHPKDVQSRDVIAPKLATFIQTYSSDF